jgi:hypothetical protein
MEQFGFRTNLSTNKATYSLLDQILIPLNEGYTVGEMLCEDPVIQAGILWCLTFKAQINSIILRRRFRRMGLQSKYYNVNT